MIYPEVMLPSRIQVHTKKIQRAVEETVRAAASVKPFDDQEIFPL